MLSYLVEAANVHVLSVLEEVSGSGQSYSAPRIHTGLIFSTYTRRYLHRIPSFVTAVLLFARPHKFPNSEGKKAKKT
jgi:hypothetical protein